MGEKASAVHKAASSRNLLLSFIVRETRAAIKLAVQDFLSRPSNPNAEAIKQNAEHAWRASVVITDNHWHNRTFGAAIPFTPCSGSNGPDGFRPIRVNADGKDSTLTRAC